MALWLLWLREKFAQPVQPTLPDGSAVCDPLCRHRESLGLDTAGPYPAELLRAYQAAFFQHLQVLHHGGESDLERLGQARGRNRTLAEPLQNRPARRISQSVKDTIDPGFFLRCAPPAIQRTPSLACQFHGQVVQEMVPTSLPPIRTVGALKEGSLLGEDEIGGPAFGG